MLSTSDDMHARLASTRAQGRTGTALRVSGVSRHARGRSLRLDTHARLNEVTPFPGSENVGATTGVLKGLRTITGTFGSIRMPCILSRRLCLSQPEAHHRHTASLPQQLSRRRTSPTASSICVPTISTWPTRLPTVWKASSSGAPPARGT